MGKLNGIWVYWDDRNHHGSRCYEFTLTKTHDGWGWVYNLDHSGQFNIGLRKNRNIETVNIRDYFGSWPKVTRNELLMFELQFGLDSSPLVELGEIVSSNKEWSNGKTKR